MTPAEIGQRLRERRQELGLELADVQRATKIRAKYIRALEAGVPEELPAPVYTKGFIRSIGNFLGLDGFALMQEYAAQLTAEKQETEPAADRQEEDAKPPEFARSPAGPPVHSPVRDGGIPTLLVVFLVFVLLLGAGYAVNRYVLDDTAPVADEPHAEAQQSNDSAKPEEPAPETPSEEAEAESSGEDPDESEAATPDKPQLEVESSANNKENIITYELLAEKGELPDRLQLAVEAGSRCWVRVTSTSTDELFFEGTLTRGVKKSWTDTEGIRIRAGAPEALTLSLNSIDLGTPVDTGVWTLIFRKKTN